jgi:hypothetical protein
MVVTFFDGTITTTTTAQNLFDISADRHYATWIHTHNMLAIDSIEIKTYVRDQNANVMRVYNTTVLTGVQDDPAFFIPYIPTKQYRVTIRRIAGTDRAYTWQRVEVT